nr:hypothetical protein [Tanacetum cinerariifolium]
MIIEQVIEEGGAKEEHVEDDTAAQGDDTIIQRDDAQEPIIPSLTPPTPPPQPLQYLPSTSQRVDTSEDTVMDDASNQGRMIDDLDKDDARQAESQAKIYKIDMDHASKVLSMQEDKPAKVQEVVDVVTTAKLITEVVTAASETVTAASTIISSAEPQVPAATITASLVRVVADSTRRRRKRVVIKDPEEESTTIIPADTKSKDKGKWIMSRALHTINETPAQKAAKRRKLNEEVEDLKRHLEIVPDEDDDVYTEATPLAIKVPIVYYEIIHLNNKPRYKIIRADGTHQLFVSILTLLKNFDKEDLESLWSLVKERFSTSKPNNFYDDFLLTTLRAMFERPDG